MSWEDFQKWIPMITALIVVAFDWGILYAKIKTFTNKEDVLKIIDSQAEKVIATKSEVNKMIDDKLKGHCPNTTIIRAVDVKVQALEKWKETHTEWGAIANEENHLALQELRYNLKSLCEKQGVKYQNGEK